MSVGPYRPLASLPIFHRESPALRDVVIVYFLEASRIAKNPGQRFRVLDMRVVASGAQTFLNDLLDALAGPVGLSGKGLAVNKYDLVGHRGYLLGLPRRYRDSLKNRNTQTEKVIEVNTIKTDYYVPVLREEREGAWCGPGGEDRREHGRVRLDRALPRRRRRRTDRGPTAGA